MAPSLPRLRIPFPDWIAGLAFDHVTDYEDPANGGQPGAGIALAYVKNIRYADIYEYTHGVNNIGSGIESPAVAEEFTQSLWGVSGACLQAIPAQQPGVLTVPGKSPFDWLCAAYWVCIHGFLQREWYESHLFLTGWNDCFIKIRLSQYLGQTVGWMIEAEMLQLDLVKPVFAEELLLQFAGTVSDLLRGLQTREPIDAQLEEIRRRREAEYIEEKKRTEERVQKAIREGKLCPKCGFSYKWDGVRCRHCNYRSIG